MAIEVFNRKEIKYFLTQEQKELITPLLHRYMDCDSYNKDSKTYPICNLYLDTPTNELIRKSLEKPVYKEKLRLRSYGRVPLESTVYLEIKKKFKGIVNKRRTPFILSEAYDFIQNGTEPKNSKTNFQVLEEIKNMMTRYNLSPKAYIYYERLAFFEKDDSDFRLTLDCNITVRRKDLNLENEVYGESLLPEGIWLMEAKAFKAFPLWFVHFLSQNKIFQVSFSKYGTEYTKMIKGEIYKNGTPILQNKNF